MTAGRCAQIILRAARQRKREVLMGPGRWSVLLRWIAPSVVDKIAIDTVMRPAVKRMENR
jgi:hypothetical protein